MRDASNDPSPRRSCSVLPRNLAGSFAVIAMAALIGATAQDGRVACAVDDTFRALESEETLATR